MKINRDFLTAQFVPGAVLGCGSKQDGFSPCIRENYYIDEKTDSLKVSKV